jgi:hypothetical protein
VRISSPDWLEGAACYTNSARENSASHVGLSDLEPYQKRELAGFTLAAVTSCAFLLTPLMVAAPEDRELPATALAIQFVTTHGDAPSSLTAFARASARGRARRVPSRATRRATAAIPSAQPIVAAAALTPVIVRAADVPVVRPQSDAPRSRNAVSRVLLGDGRYRVQPFPTPAAEN